MVSRKISELTELSSAASNDVIPIVDTDASQTKKIQVSNLVSNLVTNDVDVLTTKGDVVAYSGAAYVRVPVGSNDQILTADSTQDAGIKWADNGPDALTTKADILTISGSSYYRLPVGSNNQVLTADSTIGAGVKWATPAGGGGTELIESKVLTSGSGTITFSGLDLSTYGCVFFSITANTDSTSGTQTMRLTFNGDSGTNYGYDYVQDGTASTASGQTSIFLGNISRIQTTIRSSFNGVINHLPTGKVRQVLFNHVRNTQETTHGGANWNNTSNAITSITFAASANSFLTGDRFELWGLKSS